MVEKSLNRTVIGGSYVDPREPESCKIFVDQKYQSEFADFESSSIEVVDLDELTTLAMEKISNASVDIKKSIFPATPYKDIECEICSYKALCGKPYLEEKRIGHAN